MCFGSPPGHISLELVRKAKDLGYIVGSASDRTIGNQIELWKQSGIEVDFVSLKHRLADIKAKFAVSQYLHIGDTEVDRYYATQAGFDFLWIHEVPNNDSFDWLL